MFCRAKRRSSSTSTFGNVGANSLPTQKFLQNRTLLSSDLAKNNLQQHQYSSSPYRFHRSAISKRTALTFPSSGLQPANAPTQPVLVAPHYRLVQNASGNDIRSRIFCHKYHNAIVQNSAMDSLVLQRGCHSMSDFRCHLFFVRGRGRGER